MLDNQLFALILSLINAGAAGAGLPAGIQCLQAYQPTMQGTPTKPTIFIFKISDRRVGSPRKSDVYNQQNGYFDHRETQQYETTFQISALATQDPTDENSITASDIVNLVAYIMQSEDTVSTLEATGVGVLRITDVRNPYFLDDREQYEGAPSFDFTLTHKQDIVSKTPVITLTEVQILEV